MSSVVALIWLDAEDSHQTQDGPPCGRQGSKQWYPDSRRARLLGCSVTLVISVSDAATSRSASCESVRARPARDGAPFTPPPRGPSIRSVCAAQ